MSLLEKMSALKCVKLAVIADQYLASQNLERLPVPTEALLREMNDPKSHGYRGASLLVLREQVLDWANHFIDATEHPQKTYAATLYLYHLEVFAVVHDTIHAT